MVDACENNEASIFISALFVRPGRVSFLLYRNTYYKAERHVSIRSDISGGATDAETTNVRRKDPSAVYDRRHEKKVGAAAGRNFFFRQKWKFY